MITITDLIITIKDFDKTNDSTRKNFKEILKDNLWRYFGDILPEQIEIKEVK